MKPLNIFWIGVGLTVLSGIFHEVDLKSMAEGFGIAGFICIIASVCVWLSEGT